MKPFSLYIHIPFCFHKCPYCDFNTYAVSSIPEADYTSALLAELDLRATQPEWSGRVIRTIYFGGGTPSLFEAGSIRRILSHVFGLFAVSEDAEITLEANPGTIGSDTLVGYRNAGVNRLSIGAQSFKPRLLKELGRVHSADQTESAVEAARDVGYTNINLDLLYGIPKQTLAELKSDVRRLLELEPEHISAYGLTIEKGTPYYQRFRTGQLKLPKEKAVLSMMEYLETELAGHEFERYEISNYAKDGLIARHNMAYWNSNDYLGLGAGAHTFFSNDFHGADDPENDDSKLTSRRWSNYALPNKYIHEAIAFGSAESWSDSLTRKDLIFEFFFLGLRKIAGVSLKEFEGRFGQTAQETYPALIDLLIEHKLLDLSGDRLALTEKGLAVADGVIENFLDIEKGDVFKRRAPELSVIEGGEQGGEPLVQISAASNE